MWVDKVKAGIQQLQKLDIKDPDVFQHAINAYRSMGKLPVFVIDHPFLPITMFRTRTHQKDDFFEKVEDIGPPPHEAVKSYGRCNVPGHTVFYCSENRITSYAELLEYWAQERTDETIYVTISRC